MKINIPVVNFNYTAHNAYTAQKPSLTRQPTKDEFISFKGRSLNAQMEKIGEENIPERVLKKIDEVIATQGKYADATIYDIHQEVYKPLQDCTSLAEAKKLYPEFEAVKDIAQVEFKKGTIGARIQSFEYKGLNPDDISLKLLKKVYYSANALRNKEDYFGISKNTLVPLLDKLNITPFKTKYSSHIQYNRPALRTQLSKQTQGQWDDPKGRAKLLPHLQSDEMKANNRATLNELRQDADFEKKRKAFFETDEWRKKMSKLSKERWEDDDYARNISEKIKTIWENDDYRAERSKSTAELWTNAEYRELQAQAREALNQDPKYKARLSDAAKERWEDPVYRVKTSDAIKAGHNTPEYIEKAREQTLKRWQNPDFVAKQQPIIKARKAAWDEMQDVKAIMKELALEFPRLGKILAKVDSGQKLTEAEKAYHSKYFAIFNELCPDFGERFSKLLRKWVAHFSK